MATVKLNRTPEQFWRMSLKELDALLREYGRQENDRLRTEAKLTGLAVVCYQHGIEPFKDEEKKQAKVVVNNDAGFAGM